MGGTREKKEKSGREAVCRVMKSRELIGIMPVSFFAAAALEENIN
jgi:hypothetical protein